mmetsp:Transcript_10063/g.22240  ORF Transcript_10063/g.22240 Transcript_10063/m.22240 type:complete len:98 (+) Transcript_10063:817-1110(+)
MPIPEIAPKAFATAEWFSKNLVKPSPVSVGSQVAKMAPAANSQNLGGDKKYAAPLTSVPNSSDWKWLQTNTERKKKTVKTAIWQRTLRFRNSRTNIG